MNYLHTHTLSVQAALDRADDNERQAMAEQLAEDDWDAFMRGDDTEPAREVREYMEEEAGNYIADLVRGGDYRDAAMRRLRNDCCGYRAALLVDSDRVEDAL